MNCYSFMQWIVLSSLCSILIAVSLSTSSMRKIPDSCLFFFHAMVVVMWLLADWLLAPLSSLLSRCCCCLDLHFILYICCWLLCEFNLQVLSRMSIVVHCTMIANNQAICIATVIGYILSHLRFIVVCFWPSVVVRTPSLIEWVPIAGENEWSTCLMSK